MAQQAAIARADGADRSLQTGSGHAVSREIWLAILTLAIFILMLFVFVISPAVQPADGTYSLVLSDSILRHGSTYLDDYRFPGPIINDGSCVPSVPLAHTKFLYQLDRIKGNVVYCYPNGSAILSVPFVALMEVFGLRPASPGGIYSPIGEGWAQKLLAAALMACLVGVIFRTAHLLLDTPESLLIAVGSGLGTQIWSTASRTLWPQTWLILLAGWVALLLLRCERHKTKMRAAMLATLLSWMYFVRPTAAIPVVCISIYMFMRYRKGFALFAATGASWLGGFLLYSSLTFGKPIPPYYLSARLDWSNVPQALAGVLISPSRGFLVFVPIAGFVLYVLVRYWCFVEYKMIAVVGVMIVTLHTALITLWPFWWGGYSYGPRLETDIVPWLVMLAILGLAARRRAPVARHHRAEAWAGGMLLVVSVLMNGRGAISPSTRTWNYAVRPDRYPGRLFDWSYPQFLGGLIPAPKYITKAEQTESQRSETRQVSHD